MSQNSWDNLRACQELERLIQPGVVGFYTHVEVTEIFAVPGKGQVPLNVLSILSLEERFSAAAEPPRLLNIDRIRLRQFPEWAFGIQRYTRPLGDLVPALKAYGEGHPWQFSGEELILAEPTPVPPQFVPPNTFGSIPLNRVLKNNIWNGAFVFEWVDAAKKELRAFFDEPAALQQLTAAIRTCVPLGLDGLSDRLGNIVVQLPITVLMARFGQDRVAGDFTVAIGWHPKATPRPLRATLKNLHDQAISEYASGVITGELTRLPVNGGQGLHRSVVWDDHHRLVLAASGELAFMDVISFAMHGVRHEGLVRTFEIPDRTGTSQQISVPLISPPDVTSTVGEPRSNPAGPWTNRRIYDEEAARLEREKRFVQYRPQPGKKAVQHEKALEDLRGLIRQHGQEGAWLWDPFLDAEDIVKTLFFCPHPNADLRALTAGREPLDARDEEEEDLSASASFVERQRHQFENLVSDFRAFKLEFRIKRGQAGWRFHDRFLIFPNAQNGTRAWSLGTSVNSLGIQHHILQETSNAQLIAQAFTELWDALGHPDCCIWNKS